MKKILFFLMALAFTVSIKAATGPPGISKFETGINYSELSPATVEMSNTMYSYIPATDDGELIVEDSSIRAVKGGKLIVIGETVVQPVLTYRWLKYLFKSKISRYINSTARHVNNYAPNLRALAFTTASPDILAKY